MFGRQLRRTLKTKGSEKTEINKEETAGTQRKLEKE